MKDTRLAAERGQTLPVVVDEFLAGAPRRSSAPKKRLVSLPVFYMGEPRVNIADCDQLLELTENTAFRRS